MKRLLNYISKNLLILTIYIISTVYIVYAKALTLQIPVIASLFIITVIITIINNISLKLSRCILVAYSLILGTQISSILLTGNYIDAVALSNIDEYTSISVASRIKILTVIGCYILAAFLIKLSPARYTKKKYLTIILIFLTITTMPQKIPLPATSFINLACTTITQYYKHCKTDKRIKAEQKKLYGKDYVVMNPDEELISPVPDLRNKNIIVFFTESLSAPKIDLFNKYTALSPNLSALIKKAVYFDNYYNHTFSTYRGLRGQLSSSYQYTGFVKSTHLTNTSIIKKFTSEITTLPQILNQNNYHTYFLSAQTNTSCNLNYMLSTLGFNHIFTPEEFNFDKDITDQQLFTILTKLTTENKLQEPYFLAVYNLGTHFGEDSPDIKYQDEKNPYLNTMHNFDNAFGKWIDTISLNQTSFNNLAIILTADHAAYAEQAYCDTFNYEPEYWVDKIPLAIYTPNIAPQMIDAKGRNSLDLAPTILHMLHINKAKNYFLGCSLFKPTCILPFNHYTVAAEMFFKTQDNFIYPKTHLEDWDLHILTLIENFYHLSESLSEITDKE